MKQINLFYSNFVVALSIQVQNAKPKTLNIIRPCQNHHDIRQCFMGVCTAFSDALGIVLMENLING
jgi:hypothetical protein